MRNAGEEEDDDDDEAETARLVLAGTCAVGGRRGPGSRTVGRSARSEGPTARARRDVTGRERETATWHGAGRPGRHG